MVWEYDPAALDCMLRAAGPPARGDLAEAWKQINQGLFFAHMEQQRWSQPSLAEDRGERRRVIKDFDKVLGHLHGDASPLGPGLSVNWRLFDWLIRAELRELHPEGPRLPENRRGDSVPMHSASPLLREEYGDVQDMAQERVLRLIAQAGPPLGSLRELLAASVAADAAERVRGRGPGLVRAAFVDGAAAAYELAYGLPAAPGSKETSGGSSPAVRFVEAAANEARKARTIAPAYLNALRLALQMTPNTINRLLAERSARRGAG